MKNFHLTKGLDIPLRGEPEQVIRPGHTIRHVALLGDDYMGLKPTMLVREGDRVKLGQQLLTDKKNEGVIFTSPGCGTVREINRGAKRKFESLVIALEGDEEVTFQGMDSGKPGDVPPEALRRTLLDSGSWTCFRTRPYGKIPAPRTLPSSLFVTAIDTAPLAPDPLVIIEAHRDDFFLGLEILRNFPGAPVNLCLAGDRKISGLDTDHINIFTFSGPHPAGLPSTHIHFIDPVNARKQVWHICYQDVIGIGHLFRTGRLFTERIISMGGPGVAEPSLIRTRMGASITELCAGLLNPGGPYRTLSGSVLEGRRATGVHDYLGKYHRQISVILEGSGRGLLNWLRPGSDRFSVTGLFLSSFIPKGKKGFAMNSAVWGGRRAIFPLGTYEKVMPLDIIATSLLKSLAGGDIEKSTALGCLELVEEDLALCSFVCPGKNDFGAMLRSILSIIEKES